MRLELFLWYILFNIINIMGKSITTLPIVKLSAASLLKFAQNSYQKNDKIQCLSSNRETFFPKSTSVSYSDRVTISFTRCVSGQRDVRRDARGYTIVFLSFLRRESWLFAWLLASSVSPLASFPALTNFGRHEQRPP